MFEFYRDVFNGALEESEFGKLIPYAINSLKAIASKHVAFWNLSRLTFDDDECYRLLSLQVEFLNNLGGVEALNSGMLQSISSISTSGFNIEYGKSMQMIGGMPISNVVCAEFVNYLRQKGLTKIGIS